MSVFAELHDGRKLEFPDGTDPAIVQSTVKKVLGVKSMADQIPDMPPQPAPYKDDSSFLDKAIGVGQAAANVGTGMAAMIPAAGAALGAGIGSVASGDFGTQRGVQGVGRSFNDVLEKLTYEPSRAKGQEYAETAGKVINEVVPIMPMSNIQVHGQLAKPAFDQARGMTRKPYQPPTPKEAFMDELARQGKSPEEIVAAWEASQQPKPTGPTVGETVDVSPAEYESMGKRVGPNYDLNRQGKLDYNETPADTGGNFVNPKLQADYLKTLEEAGQPKPPTDLQIEGMKSEPLTPLEAGKESLGLDLVPKEPDIPLVGSEAPKEPVGQPLERTLKDTRRAVVEFLDQTRDITPALAPIAETHMREMAQHAINLGKDTYPKYLGFLKAELGPYFDRLKTFAKAAWEYVKDIQPGLSIRGNVQEALAKTVGITTEKQARYNALVEENKGILPLSTIKEIHKAREALLKDETNLSVMSRDPQVDHLPTTVQQFVKNFGGIVTPFEPWLASVKEGLAKGVLKPMTWNSENPVSRSQYFSGQMVKILTRNEIAGRVVNNVIRALGQAEKNASNFINGIAKNTLVFNQYESGGGMSTWAKELKRDFVAKKAVIDAGFEADRAGQGYLSEPQLRAKGFSDHQVRAYQELSAMFQKSWDGLRQAKIAAESPDPGARPGYWPDIRFGEYWVSVKDMNGEPLIYEPARTLREAKNQAAQIKQHFKSIGQEVQTTADIRRGYNKLENALSGIDALYQFTGNPKGKKAQMVREFHQKLLAQTGGGIAKNTMNKTGYAGAAGNEFGKTPKEQVTNFEKATEYYIEGVARATEFAKVSKEVHNIISDPELIKADPLGVQYASDYWDNARGVHKNYLALIDHSAEAFSLGLGLGRGMPKAAVQFGKAVVGGMYLMFYSPKFLIVNGTQPVTRAIKGLTMAQAFGIETSPILDTAHGIYKAFDPANTNSVNRLYANREHLSTPQLINDMNSGLTVRTAMNVIGGHAVGKLEKVTRYMEFMILSDVLLRPENRAKLAEHGYKTKEEVMEMARNWQDNEMTDYRPAERAQLFQNTGLVGEAASTFSAYNHNSVGHNYHYLQLARAGKLKPLATSALMMLALSGLYTIPGMMAVQKLIEYYNKLTNNNYMGPTDLITSYVPDSIAYGAWGFHDSIPDLSASNSEGSPIPGEGRVGLNMLPPFEYAWNAVNDLVALIGQGLDSTKEAKFKAMSDLFPKSAQAFIDEYGRTPHGELRDPHNPGEGLVLTKPFGANDDTIASIIGTRTTGTNKEKAIGRMQERIRKETSNLRASEFKGLYQKYGENLEKVPDGAFKKLIERGHFDGKKDMIAQYEKYIMDLISTKSQRAWGYPNTDLSAEQAYIYNLGEAAREKPGLSKLWK